MALRNLAAIQRLPGSATAVESRSSRIGPINLGVKQTGERSAGNPHAAFDVAGSELCASSPANLSWSPVSHDPLGATLARSPKQASEVAEKGGVALIPLVDLSELQAAVFNLSRFASFRKAMLR